MPRDLIIFIGNPKAYAQGLRHLENQLDYNRIWSAEGDSLEHLMAKVVLEYLGNSSLYAGVDIHNNKREKSRL